MKDPGVSKKELLRYVKLEEDEETAELLTQSSFLYVGSAVRNGIEHDFWSYPTPSDVAWVSLSNENALGTEVLHDVPSSIRDATAPREKHPIRTISRKQERPIDRSPISEPKWVPYKDLPHAPYFPVWEEDISFEFAVMVFAAKPKRVNVGYWRLCFGIKLTSGRYALITAHEKKQELVSIELEVQEDAETRRKDSRYYGFMHTSDLRELMGVLGREYKSPPEYQYQLRE